MIEVSAQCDLMHNISILAVFHSQRVGYRAQSIVLLSLSHDYYLCNPVSEAWEIGCPKDAIVIVYLFHLITEPIILCFAHGHMFSKRKSRFDLWLKSLTKCTFYCCINVNIVLCICLDLLVISYCTGFKFIFVCFFTLCCNQKCLVRKTCV